jgi:NAD(P)-dependent dehydrogenase (short-subunit alcohol dehydrogenase family)
LVTGGSRGVGSSVALRLAAEGASVAVNYRRDADAAATVVNEIIRRGGRAFACPAAVEDQRAVDAMVEEVSARLGKLDLLVSNAGRASRGATIAATDIAEMADLMWVHAFGPLYLIQRTLPALREAERADVIVISSSAVRSAPAASAPYTMAKAAMETAARTLAREERAHGIRVNIVAPGLVDTDMGARLVRAIRPGEEISGLHGSSAFGRVCQPDDVAAVVAFLASADASYITGEVLTVDGGGDDPKII